jgi:hypothetical protein
MHTMHNSTLHKPNPFFFFPPITLLVAGVSFSNFFFSLFPYMYWWAAASTMWATSAFVRAALGLTPSCLHALRLTLCKNALGGAKMG